MRPQAAKCDSKNDSEIKRTNSESSASNLLIRTSVSKVRSRRSDRAMI
jgi:hypothetical protein